MNASQKQSYNFYVTTAKALDASKSVAQLRKVLATLDVEGSLKSETDVREVAASTRTAMLHRARAVKATAKARANA